MSTAMTESGLILSDAELATLGIIGRKHDEHMDYFVQLAGDPGQEVAIFVGREGVNNPEKETDPVYQIAVMLQSMRERLSDTWPKDDSTIPAFFEPIFIRFSLEHRQFVRCLRRHKMAHGDSLRLAAITDDFDYTYFTAEKDIRAVEDVKYVVAFAQLFLQEINTAEFKAEVSSLELKFALAVV
jgi:hypothetical protein